MPPDASNVCLPPLTPVIASTPPVPVTERAQRCVLEGRSGRLNSGKPIVSYCSGKLVVIRSLANDPILPGTASKLPVLIYRGHLQGVTCVKLSPSGAYCATGDGRGTLKVWAFDHEEHLTKFDGPASSGPINDISWCGESKRIAVGGDRSDAQSDAARVIQWDTGVSMGELGQHLKGRVAGISFKPQRPFRIVSCGREDHKLSFNAGPPFSKVPSKDGIPAETSHSRGVQSVRYNHAGTLVASIAADKTVCMYDGKTLELKHKLEGVHNLTIFACAWSADDKNLLTCSSDGKVKLLSVAEDGTMKIEKEWDPPKAQMGGADYDKVPIGGHQLGCTFLDGKTPISVSYNGQLCILKDKIEVLTGHSAAIDGLGLDTKNQVFYTGDTNGLLCKWDLKTGKPMHRIEPTENKDLMYVVHGGAVSGVAVLEGDGTMLSVGWDDKLFITSKGSKTVGATPVGLGAQPSAIASGTNLAAIATVQGILLANSSGLVGSMFKTSFAGHAVCVTKDDKMVYVAGDDKKIHIYDVDGTSLKEKHVIDNGHLQPIHALALSNDESKLASADIRDVCVWDLKDSYKPLIARGRWCFHTQRVTCLAWSPDDKLIASGGADDNVFLWSLTKKMRRRHYKYCHRGGLTGLEFTKDQYKFLTVGMDACVNLWDVADDVKETFGF